MKSPLPSAGVPARGGSRHISDSPFAIGDRAMPTIIEMTNLGTPEVLFARDVPAQPLKHGELRLRHTVVGFNYLDVYLRKGVYGVPLPCVLGVEAAGRVIELGEGVRGFKVGDRIAYTNELGAYATERILDASRAIALPDDISDENAAALLFKGQTAHMLLRRVYRVSRGDAILVHAAAGGVGLVLARWAKALGATVIGTVGSYNKVELARSNGCDHVAVLDQDDVASFVRDVTGGAGVQAVYDSIGRDTFEASMKSLAPFGVMVSYGQASGELDPIEPRPLSRYGSPLFTRANVDWHIADTPTYHSSAAEVFDLIRSGTLIANIGQRFPLTAVAEAHRLAESRATRGSTLLIA
ncbi:zinc-binding dehydrogenase [Sinorhizobium medicae]|nr:zinc-binding dehydrogenase [Sinorhizobium medicae]MDX0998850.1 zinc-binding dehydrogenase [Sinorhizobium medicae]MDX1182795.1 zinc-binding dehydrogenase [Sinorhizobium medicae]